MFCASAAENGTDIYGKYQKLLQAYLSLNIVDTKSEQQYLSLVFFTLALLPVICSS